MSVIDNLACAGFGGCLGAFGVSGWTNVSKSSDPPSGSHSLSCGTNSPSFSFFSRPGVVKLKWHCLAINTAFCRRLHTSKTGFSSSCRRQHTMRTSRSNGSSSRAEPLPHSTIWPVVVVVKDNRGVGVEGGVGDANLFLGEHCELEEGKGLLSEHTNGGEVAGTVKITPHSPSTPTTLFLPIVVHAEARDGSPTSWGASKASSLRNFCLRS